MTTAIVLFPPPPQPPNPNPIVEPPLNRLVYAMFEEVILLLYLTNLLPPGRMGIGSGCGPADKRPFQK